MIRVHRLFWKCRVIAGIEAPRYACWLVGRDAMPLSVALLTLPKPTAITAMPSSFRICAVAMAPDEPPYWLFCSPSLSTTATRR